MTESYNGWPASPDPSAIGVVSSRYFPGGVKAGDVAAVLGYCVTQWHLRVEPLVDGWNWGYTFKQSANSASLVSCHSSGTAADVNAPLHPNGGPQYGGLSPDQVAEVRRILDEVQGTIGWGADFSGTKDPMHLEVQVDAATLAAVAATLPADGGAPPPAPDPWKDPDGMTTSVMVNGTLNVFAVGEGGRVFQQWPDPAQPSGWSGWIAGVPGSWRGGLSATTDASGGLSLFGVDPDGTVQQVWTGSEGWAGPVPFTGITVPG